MAKTTVSTLYEKYAVGEPLTMLTAYDAEIARLVDEAGVDLILVGDSAGQNQLGYGETIPVTMQEALSNTAAVVRGAEDAFVVADMPFLSYGTSIAESVTHAGQFLKDARADAVKLETEPSGETTVRLVDRLTELGIPVQGHIGYTPQHEHALGGAVIQGREDKHSVNVDTLVETAQRLAEAGAFSIVLETMTEEAAKQVTDAVDVPTIGIGAGRHVDGQVLVVNDVIGLGEAGYKLSKQYADVGGEIHRAVETYVSEVKEGEFPTEDHAYDPID